EGIREHDPDRTLVRRWEVLEALDDRVVVLALEGEPERLDPDPRQRRGPRRHGRRVLDLAAGADHAAGGAAQDHGSLDAVARGVDDRALRALVLRRDEEEDEVGGLTVE